MTIFLFGLLSVVSVASVLAMIISRNQAYNALFLVLCFASLGGVFGLLQAPFVAVVQIIVYAGAIMVLFLFTLMMVNFEHDFSTREKRRIRALSAILAVVICGEIVVIAWKIISSGPSVLPASGGGDPKTLGHLLLTKYLYPFEITSILLVAALVGALTLARKENKS